MKKLVLVLFSTILLTACSNTSSNNTENKSSSSKSSITTSKRSKTATPKPNLNKKYPGFKLATIPDNFQGTWYQTDIYSTQARKFIITKHTIMDSVVYQKTDPNLNLSHRSEKDNKTYAGNATMVSFEDKNGSQWLRARGFLDTADIIYITGTFKGHRCLYLAYSSGDIHSAIFKDRKAALKYRKYDFSQVTNPSN
ncbi:hypothetical protein HMPREF0514_11074 [Lactobacillus paragasseri JV-V03]|uniref:Lipocalin-like domain-containing protein n=1 Tax=Lactobacillus paragasseri JV-V03 TaxID=525326 RepID=A0AA86ZWR3_9LACO|nr:membrane lipoprotein lipid attachment site-containing protein [Lactobacillus paragasseri]EFJ70630.1 hypothetical protein HMPREF0514_11074 [Lactobacillus paragasseri JV-V03]